MPRLSRLSSLRFGSLKVRIAVLYGVLFAAVLAVIMVIAGQGISRFGEESAARDLQANARVFDEILDLRAQQMRGSADVLSRDFGFREAVATGDRETIASALASLRARSRTDAAFLVGYDRSLVANSDRAVPDVDSLWQTLDDGTHKGVIALGDRIALAAASPVQAPDTIGWLVVVQSLDASALERLTQLAAIDVEARVSKSAELPPVLRDAPEGEVFEGEAGERFLYLVSDIAVMQDGLVPRLVLRHSLRAALAEYSSLQWLLTGLSLAGLMLVLLLSYRVARGITHPLRKLDAATRLIGEGKEVELVAETDDEVGRLVDSFNSMVGAIEERERRIVHVSLHDELTGLPNRKLFIEQLDQALRRRKDPDKLAVIYVDLDDFKVINDTLGHPAGDTLLREVSAKLREELEDATIARLGGDEFAILFTDIGPEADLVAMADRVQSCFDSRLTIDGQQADSSASLGIALAPGDGEDGIALMKNADLALYRAKHEGKASYHFFEQSLDEQARKRRQMELDMRLAIRDGQFELHFQPLYNLSEERLQGFEALIRWNHPVRGMVSPVEFIPLAEETGLIVQIGEWVVREACREAANWPGNLSVAVNVSPKQFGTPGLSNAILQALASTGLEPSRLELEITESIFISNVEKTLETLHSLRDLGIRIALDDFGTGYSSLSYLRSFPFDKVKIDQSFVRDLDAEGNGHAVIRAITTLAEALGMETLAEGVEDSTQLEILQREGCRYIQGYLLSRPLPVADVMAMIGDGTTGGRFVRAA